MTIIQPTDPQHKALYDLQKALESLQEAKPEERGELTRRYAVTITDLEKVIAYYETFILGRAYWPDSRP